MIESTGFSIVSLLRGLLGIICVLSIAFLCSTDRKRIDWKLVVSGLCLQLVLALSILYVPFVGAFFEILGKMFVKVLTLHSMGSTSY